VTMDPEPPRTTDALGAATSIPGSTVPQLQNEDSEAVVPTALQVDRKVGYAVPTTGGGRDQPADGSGAWERQKLFEDNRGVPEAIKEYAKVQPHPRMNIISRATFGWLSAMVKLGYTRNAEGSNLEPTDLWEVQTGLQSTNVGSHHMPHMPPLAPDPRNACRVQGAGRLR